MFVKFWNENHFREPESEIPLIDPEIDEAGREADAAKAVIDGRISERRSKPCARHHSCLKYTLSIRRKGDYRDSKHAKGRCGRFDCPSCRRDWTVKHLTRAADRITSADPGSTTQRLGTLHFSIVPAERWDAVSKEIRRRSQGVGHARIFTNDGLCLIISERDFRGASAVSVLDAVNLAADAIECAVHEMHAVRWLGRWNVPGEKSEYEIVRHTKTIDDLQSLAKELGGTADIQKGLLVVKFSDCVSDANVAGFWQWVESVVVQFHPMGFNKEHSVELDNDPPDAPDWASDDDAPHDSHSSWAA